VFARKKKRENRGGDFFTNADLAYRLAQDLLQPAILAVFGQNLPFWQFPLLSGDVDRTGLFGYFTPLFRV
jgi:hypothetical protein